MAHGFRVRVTVAGERQGCSWFQMRDPQLVRLVGLVPGAVGIAYGWWHLCRQIVQRELELVMNKPGSFALNWVFSDVDKRVDPRGPVRMIPDMPLGIGLVAGWQEETTPDFVAQFEAHVNGTGEFPRLAVFRLPSGDDSPDADVLDGPVVPAAGKPGLGSEALALALLAGSMPGVLSALADGLVLLPVVPGPAWRMEVRLFGAPGEEGPGDLCLFSSADTMEGFLGEGCGAYFVVQHGPAVLEFLTRHGDKVADVVFDPAGPYSLRVPVATMTGFLDRAQVEVAALEAVLSRWSGPEVKGYDLHLGPGWAHVDIKDAARRDEQIRVLMEARTRWMGDFGTEITKGLCSSYSVVAANAAECGGTDLYVLWKRPPQRGSLDLVSFLHDLGPTRGGKSHLDQIEESIQDRCGPDQDLLRMDLAGTTILRHCQPHSEKAPGAPGFSVDYYLPAPDGEHVAHFFFSSLDSAGKDSLTRLTDGLVLGGAWVMGDEPGIPDTVG